MTIAPAETPSSPTGPLVAPFITEVVGDVGRPRAVLTPSANLSHLPGESGLVVGAKNIRGWRRHGVAHAMEQCRRFGPVHRSQMGPLPYVGVADPEMLLSIVRNEDRVWSAAVAWSSIFEGINPASETFDAPVTLDFDRHRDARRILQPGFSPAAMTSYVAVASETFEDAVDAWADASVVEFKPTIRGLLAAVSARTFVGFDEELGSTTLDRALADVWGGTFALVDSPTHRRAMKGYERLRARLGSLVSARRARPGADLLSRICASATGSDWLDDATLVRLFIGVMAAAFDTTSCGLTSMAYLLAIHPEWQEEIREEVTSSARERFVYGDGKSLPATEMAWKETLRLFPVAPTLPRTALRDVALGPWQIPAGTFVQGLIGPTMRDPTWWTNPDRFDPERFADTRAEDKAHRGLFMPFGAGAHACIGMQLANVQAKAFWFAVLSRCRFRLTRPYEANHQYAPLGSVSGQVAMVIEKL